MSRTLEICGYFIEEAIERGLDVLDMLRDGAALLDERALDDRSRPLYEAIVQCLDIGHPPTPANLKAASPALTGAVLGDARRLATDGTRHNSLSAAILAANAEYQKAAATQGLKAALAALEKGEVETARHLYAQVELPGAPEALQGKSRYEDFTRSTALERPFVLTHDNLNHILRGGLGTGTLMGMSLWVAPTGMGKSTFWYGEIPHLCKQGHWVLYFAAESDDSNIYSEVTRMHAGMTLDSLERIDSVPQFAAKFDKARAELAAYMGKAFSVWSGPFDFMTVRQEAERTLREMREAGATGKLLVIIDNYDALYEMVSDDSKAGAVAVNNEIHRLSRHVGKHDYHVAMLAQAPTEDESKKGPGSGQVYNNRKIGQKFSTVVALYRPRPDETEDGVYPCIAVRKARQRRNVSPIVQMKPDDAVGLWTELNKLPF